ncbi:hypothetical protein B0H13DRAFT_1862997 [Mycena leptocephala]|nr:hypothetical protein B0H13DRAFT_1862997 [Mycena leptocephala]
MKSIAVGCRKMGYIIKTSSIYRKPASRKEAVLWYHMVTENGSSSPNGVAELVAGQRRRRRCRWRWKWGIGERIGEEEERGRMEKEEEEESNRGNSAVNGEQYPNSVSAADRTPSPLYLRKKQGKYVAAYKPMVYEMNLQLMSGTKFPNFAQEEYYKVPDLAVKLIEKEIVKGRTRDEIKILSQTIPLKSKDKQISQSKRGQNGDG